MFFKRSDVHHVCKNLRVIWTGENLLAIFTHAYNHFAQKFVRWEILPVENDYFPRWAFSGKSCTDREVSGCHYELFQDGSSRMKHVVYSEHYVQRFIGSVWRSDELTIVCNTKLVSRLKHSPLINQNSTIMN